MQRALAREGQLTLSCAKMSARRTTNGGTKSSKIYYIKPVGTL